MLQVENIIEKLKLLFSMNDYENAEKLLISARRTQDLYNDVVAIYDATLSYNKVDYEQMWEAIRRGLIINPYNYELYVLLGEYYLNKNLEQAYLCFENALFHCENAEDRTQIQDLMNSLKENNNISVNNVSFIILSYNTLDYTKTCIDSIRKNSYAPSREIVIVDNASNDGSLEWLREQEDIVLRENTENSGFPKGCNQGVEVAKKENDVFLLNSDTFLPPNALFWLRMGLYENDKVGSTGSITNYAANMQAIHFEDGSVENMLNYAAVHNVPKKYPYEEKLHLIGFALLIKRSIWDELGELDERFSPGNFEDNDYGIRVVLAGYKNILCWNSFIIHFGSKSFGKNKQTFSNLLSINAQKFEEKWKISPIYYFHARTELIDLVTEEQEASFNVLDIGCGCGATSMYLRRKFPNATTYGVEIVPEAANIAEQVFDVVCADIETLEFPWEKDFFDYVILGDVLEHLHNPMKVLKRLLEHVKKGGHIIVSMPNVKHYSVMLRLIVNDEFHYTDAGILDYTHLKMYTRKEIAYLIQESGFTIENMLSVVMGMPDERTNELVDMLVSLSASKDKNEYLAYQYIVKAHK